MGTTVRLVSLNVNGLNTPKKRDRVMTKVKKDGAQIIYLQETHLNKIEHDKLKKYGYRNVYSSSFKGGPRRGVTIMISNQVQFEYEKEISLHVCMFSPCSQGVSSSKNPNRKNMQNNRTHVHP